MTLTLCIHLPVRRATKGRVAAITTALAEHVGGDSVLVCGGHETVRLPATVDAGSAELRRSVARACECFVHVLDDSLAPL